MGRHTNTLTNASMIGGKAKPLKASKKEKKELKEDVLHEMLPFAFDHVRTLRLLETRARTTIRRAEEEREKPTAEWRGWRTRRSAGRRWGTGGEVAPCACPGRPG